MSKVAMTIELTWDQVNLLSEALTQYVDNSDPEECNDPDVGLELVDPARYQLAVEMRDQMDAKLQSLAESPLDVLRHTVREALAVYRKSGDHARHNAAERDCFHCRISDAVEGRL